MTVDRSVQLSCNTSLSRDIMWSYDNDDGGYVDYVYWNGRIDTNRLSVKSTADDVHSLVIFDAEPKDSGLYECFDAQGTKIVGYQLIINGMSFRYCDAMKKVG